MNCPDCKQGKLVLDKDTDTYRDHVEMEEVGAVKDDTQDLGFDFLIRPKRCLYQCPRCKKVIIQ